SAYVLQPPPTPAEPIDDDYTHRFVDTMVGRAPDGRRLAAAFRPTAPLVAFDAALKIAAADLSAVQAVASKWLAWDDSTFAAAAGPRRSIRRGVGGAAPRIWGVGGRAAVAASHGFTDVVGEPVRRRAPRLEQLRRELAAADRYHGRQWLLVVQRFDDPGAGVV